MRFHCTGVQCKEFAVCCQQPAERHHHNTQTQQGPSPILRLHFFKSLLVV